MATKTPKRTILAIKWSFERSLFTLFLLLLPFSLFSDTHPLTFDTLKSHSHRQEVEIRGFLYTAPDGRLILAAEPNLKTCCLGSPSKIGKQITLVGGENIPKTSRAQLFKGTFFSTIEGDTPHYFLENPVVIEESTHQNAVLLLLGIGIMVCFYYIMTQK